MKHLVCNTLELFMIQVLLSSRVISLFSLLKLIIENKLLSKTKIY